MLGIDGPIFTPVDSEDGFKNRVALVGVTPANPTHLGRFAILLEPIANGKIGQPADPGQRQPVAALDEDRLGR